MTMRWVVGWGGGEVGNGGELAAGAPCNFERAEHATQRRKDDISKLGDDYAGGA